MKAEFNEAQYQCALCNELTNIYLFNQLIGKTSFKFTTAIEETKIGYDAKLSYRYTTLYLQFKVADYINSNRGKYSRHFGVPYYYFKVRTSLPHSYLRIDCQHNLLVKLANLGNSVYYVSPIFHTNRDFDLYYVNNQIRNNSKFISVLNLPFVASGSNHSIVYNRSAINFFSKSFQINEDGTFSELLDNISENKFITLKKIIENNLRIIKEVFKIDLKTDSFNEIQHFFNKHNIYIFLIQEEEK